MRDAFQYIENLIQEAQDKPDFLEALFGTLKQEALDGRAIILFGAGNLGVEMQRTFQRFSLSVSAFCDNDAGRQGTLICGLPVLSPADLCSHYPNALIVLSLQNHRFKIIDQLVELGWKPSQIFRKPNDPFQNIIAMYAMVGTQDLQNGFERLSAPKTILEDLKERAPALQKSCDLMADHKSKELFLWKLAVHASGLSFYLFEKFILQFSEAIHEFGILNYEGTTEDYFYYNNDVLDLSEGEILVDVGAYDGDTVKSFMETCRERHISFKHIYAFEPDHVQFKKLKSYCDSYENITPYELGLLDENKKMRFLDSGETIHDQAGSIDQGGTIEIKVARLDDVLGTQRVTFLKMDPAGDVLNKIIKGARILLETQKPKMALGNYHSLEEFIDLPLLIHEICPDYRFYLRHNTYHLCDTNLYVKIS